MLKPRGVAVYLQAHHLYVEMRGVRETSLLTQTTVWRSEYEHNAALQVEFLARVWSREVIRLPLAERETLCVWKVM